MGKCKEEAAFVIQEPHGFNRGSMSGGAKIGDNSVIAAGCVVHGDVPENSKMIQRRETIIREK